MPRYFVYGLRPPPQKRFGGRRPAGVGLPSLSAEREALPPASGEAAGRDASIAPPSGEQWTRGGPPTDGGRRPPICRGGGLEVVRGGRVGGRRDFQAVDTRCMDEI